jgi:hypothetical protein
MKELELIDHSSGILDIAKLNKLQEHFIPMECEYHQEHYFELGYIM